MTCSIRPAVRSSWRACSVASEPPVFVHHALVMKTATQKLSKSDGDTGIRDLRAEGWTAARVLGHAAALAGLQATPDPIDAAAVVTLFEGPDS